MTIGLSSSHRPSSRGRLVSRLTAGAVVLVAVGVGSSALASDATSDPLTFTGCLGRIGVIYNVSTNPVETLVPVHAGDVISVAIGKGGTQGGRQPNGLIRGGAGGDTAVNLNGQHPGQWRPGRLRRQRRPGAAGGRRRRRHRAPRGGRQLSARTSLPAVGAERLVLPSSPT